MENCTIQDIASFIDACDNMISSKYILVDKRLGDVLKSIASTRQVFNLISDCMVGFNFDREYAISVSKQGQFIVPEEQHKSIAFVFCLLNLLDDKKINFSQFLTKYFSNDEDGVGPYAYFCSKIIKSFKNNVMSALLGEKAVVREPEKKKPLYDFSKEIAERLLFLAKDFRSFVHGLKKIKKSRCTRTDLLEQINTLIIAVEEKQVQYMHALVLGIRYSIGKEKELARRLVEIDDLVAQILDQKVNANEQ